MIETLQPARDARGLVFEPLDAEGLAGQGNVHVVLTEPGHVRGNHRHARGHEVLVVLGPALIRLREDGQRRDHNVPDGEICRLRIPPGVAHAVLNTGRSPGLLVGFNSLSHDPAQPDTIRDVLIEATLH